MVDVPRTFVEALERLPAGEQRGFRFVTSTGDELFLSYDSLRREATRRAGLLAEAGVAKGDRVALVIPEGHDFVLSFLAAVIAGAVPVPIFPRATFKASSDYVDSVAHITEASGARILLSGAANAELVQPAKQRVPGLAEIAVTEALFTPERASASFAPPKIDSADLCFLQFTSGSTARPKGVMVSHGNLIANVTSFLGPHGLARRDDDVGVSWLPLFHDMGLIGFVLGPLVVDIPVVLLPTATFARGPRIWLETIHKHRGTITYAPNFAYSLALKRLKPKDVESLDLSCLRIAGCGAEPIHAETLRSFARALAPAGFKPEALLPSYGMAESTLAISFHPRGTPMEVDRVDSTALRKGHASPAPEAAADDSLEVVSCGVPFPDHELRIVDEQGQVLPERQVGQVLARGPSVCLGYFENPEATSASFPNDGFLHTGDLGYLADGKLHICGRLKDLIIIRGANFHPQDLEWAVSEIEGVRRGNVVAFSTPISGEERLVLAVECASFEASQVRARVAARVNEAFGLTPHHVATVTVGSLPKTSSGKLQRAKTRDLYIGQQLDEHAES
ncbi:MAG: fatty acyl-AMP ligase [Myxococcales bacterium]